MPPRWKGRGATRRTQGLGDPGSRPEGSDVVGAPFRVGTLQAVARDDGVDEAGMALVHLVGPEPDAPQGSRTQVGQEDVGLGHELMRQLQSALAREVEGDGSLAPVVQFEHRVRRQVTAEDVEKGPARVAFGRLDLHDVGAPVSHDAAGSGAGDPDPELDHPDAAQRPAHAVCGLGLNCDGHGARARGLASAGGRALDRLRPGRMTSPHRSPSPWASSSESTRRGPPPAPAELPTVQFSRPPRVVNGSYAKWCMAFRCVMRSMSWSLTPFEVEAQFLGRERPGGVGVRVVALPHHVVHVQELATGHTEAVVDEARQTCSSKTSLGSLSPKSWPVQVWCCLYW